MNNLHETQVIQERGQKEEDKRCVCLCVWGWAGSKELALTERKAAATKFAGNKFLRTEAKTS